jgi:ankyrin repeat protein
MGDINVQDGEGRTAILLATYASDLETAKVLIDTGAVVNIRD